MKVVVVGMADCRIGGAADEVLATYALGSCIGLAVHDPAAAVGGLLHFMLPDSAIDPSRGRQRPFMFADIGVPLLLEQVLARGASKQRLVVLAVGGANMLDTETSMEIGKRNYEALRRILSKSGLPLHGEATGGSHSRTMRLEVGTGRLWVHEPGGQRELVPRGLKRGARSVHLVC